jgi:surface antigen
VKKMKKILLMAMVGALAFAGAALAQQKKTVKVEKLTGTVVSVDAKAGKLTLKVGEKEKALTAEAKLLEGVNPGDKVEVEVAGTKVKSLKKVEAPQAPAPAPAAPPAQPK